MGMHSFPIFIHYQIKFFTIFHRGHPSHIFEYTIKSCFRIKAALLG